MNKGLQRELSFVAAAGALWGFKSRSRLATGLLSAAAVGLFVASTRNRFRFADKKVYLTGGSRGLGLSLAWNLLAQGAVVTLVARDAGELQKAKDILLKDFPRGKVFTSVCDITKSQELASSIDRAIAEMDGIDLLINNAGSILVGPFSSMEREDYEAQMRLHLYAVIEATALVTPHFQTRGGGRILNICSLGGKVSVPHMLPYDASKFALAGFAQGVTAELAPKDIIVTTAYPSVLRTGSPIQAVFKGDHEKEFAWFETLDNLPLFSTSPDTAAKKILDAVSAGSSEIVLSIPAKARIMIGAFFPELMSALMGVAARLLPTGDSEVRQTGAQSKALTERSPLLKPLRETAQKAEIEYNQEPLHNADFNMGLLH